MTLTEARDHPGDRVVYDNGHGTVEYGEITRCNDWFVFVRYDGDFWCKATDPAQLTLAGN
jgi:hypothetical protein